MVEIGDRVQIDEAVSNYYGRCGIVVHDDICRTYPYRVKFDDGDDCIFKGKDLIVLSTEKFKVGDRVKILNTEFGNKDKIGTITNISGIVLIYFVEIEGNCGHVCQWSNASDLELVEEEKVMKFKVGDKVRMIRNTYGNRGKIGTLEKIDTSTMPYCVVFDDGRKEWCYGHEFKLLKGETSMKFKVGDKVKVKDSWFGHDGQVGVVLDIDNYEPYIYNIKFDTEGDNERRNENFMGDSLELVTEEEVNVMKFKVGDKVKVKDSWFGFTGEVGLIVRIDGPAKYPYRVKFDVVDEEDEELFAEGSLELVKGKQSFTKSDLKTGMGVVLRNGDKAHVLLGTDDGDVMRFLEKDTWDTLKSANEDLTWKGMDNFDIVEVYSTKLASRYLTDMVFEEKCVFKREEPKPEPKPEPEPIKMTMKEINEHFGKAIEIIE